MGQFGMGQAVLRKEDQRFLTGTGRYLDDINLPRQARMVLLRSPFARARITSIDLEEARGAPGVLGVFSHADLAADGVRPIPCLFPMKSKDGTPIHKPPHPVLADGEVRHVGDPVVAVIAETLEQARDAAERVMVEYEDLEPVTDTAGALSPGAPRIWPDVPDNLCFDWELGDAAATQAALDAAHHLTELEIVNNRVVAVSMEPRGAIGAFNPADGSYDLHISSQGTHTVRNLICGNVLDVPPEKLRVMTPDVGGGFGMKIFLYAEYILAIWAARRIGRPVKWIGDRSESFMSDTQGRDHVTKARLALDKEGRFLGLQVDTVAALGAYLSTYGPFIASSAGASMLAGVYRTPAIHVTMRGVFTNTVPVDAYRGAGRPEAAYVIERIIDAAAAETGIPAQELRRRNFVREADFPYATPLGETYDSGAFEAVMDQAMAKADWDGFDARRQEAAQRGRLRGIGLAYYVEGCSGGADESADLRVEDNGRITLLIGTQSNGQGHETAYAQLVADGLGLDITEVTVLQGDTGRIRTGRGTGGSRSTPVGGAAVVDAVDRVVEKAKPLAAHLMETAEADIEFAEGAYRVAGTDRSVPFAEVARKSFLPRELPEGMETGLEARGTFTPPQKTYPNGCHVCELEIDPDTGMLSIERYTVVDDFGVLLNPMMAAGQVHGGVAQGIGQALTEHTVYDDDSGQLLSGSFMDYALPRAGTTVPVDLTFTDVAPCRTNPLGMKGAGEAGAIGAPPAIINAIDDALAPIGAGRIDMPATPKRLWETIQAAKGIAEAAE